MEHPLRFAHVGLKAYCVSLNLCGAACLLLLAVAYLMSWELWIPLDTPTLTQRFEASPPFSTS